MAFYILCCHLLFFAQTRQLFLRWRTLWSQTEKFRFREKKCLQIGKLILICVCVYMSVCM